MSVLADSELLKLMASSPLTSGGVSEPEKLSSSVVSPGNTSLMNTSTHIYY